MRISEWSSDVCSSDLPAHDCLAMKTRNEKQLVVGLDIGTSKVVAIVGEYEPGEPITVIGIGTHVSRGMKRGSVVDIESHVHSIDRKSVVWGTSGSVRVDIGGSRIIQKNRA